MTKTQMQPNDNVTTIKIFSKGQPEGRHASVQEEHQIRQWMRNIQHIDNANGNYQVNNEFGITIEVNSGMRPIQIHTAGQLYIEITDNMGVTRLGKQDELRAFLENQNKL